MTAAAGFTEIMLNAGVAPAPAFPWAALAGQLRSVQVGLKRFDGGDSLAGWLQHAAKVLGSVCEIGSLVWFEQTETGWGNPIIVATVTDQVVFKELAQLAGQATQAGPATTRINDSKKVTQFAVAIPIGWVARPESSKGVADADGEAHALRKASGCAAHVADRECCGCLAATFRQQSEPDDWFVALLDHAAAEFTSRLTAESLTQAQRELGSSAAVIELATKIEAAESLESACQLLVEEVAKHLSAKVALGLAPTPASNSRLQAISGVGGVDPDAPRSRLISAAIDEVLVHGRVTVFPRCSPVAPRQESRIATTIVSHSGGPRLVEHSASLSRSDRATLTHQRLVADGICQSVLGVPLKDRDGTLLGAWVCLGDEPFAANEAAINFLRACEFRLGEAIKLLRRADRSRVRRWLVRCRKNVGGSLTKVVVGASVAVVALMAVPWPHGVKCECQLEPVTRRFVAAPFDGTLEKAFVEPGQVVEQGELLARMDDREINWELAGVDAEQQRAAKERDTKLAKHEIAASQLAKYEVERLELRRRLLSHRGDHLEIRSPIAGLVIVGDLKKSEGVPLTTGKNLFEIAPLDRMVVEVAIPERDRLHADIGQEVDLTLEGFPGEHWSGTLARIHPRSEIRDQENVFIGEVELDNPGGKLLPGLHGHARLSSGWRSVGWLLFHRPIEAFVFWMGW